MNFDGELIGILLPSLTLTRNLGEKCLCEKKMFMLIFANFILIINNNYNIKS